MGRGRKCLRRRSVQGMAEQVPGDAKGRRIPAVEHGAQLDVQLGEMVAIEVGGIDVTDVPGEFCDRGLRRERQVERSEYLIVRKEVRAAIVTTAADAGAGGIARIVALLMNAPGWTVPRLW
jgi:hypothetical protein